MNKINTHNIIGVRNQFNNPDVKVVIINYVCKLLLNTLTATAIFGKLAINCQLTWFRFGEFEITRNWYLLLAVNRQQKQRKFKVYWYFSIKM